MPSSYKEEDEEAEEERIYVDYGEEALLRYKMGCCSEDWMSYSVRFRKYKVQESEDKSMYYFILKIKFHVNFRYTYV